MPLWYDKLKDNLTQKVTILERIYESDKKMIARLENPSLRFEEYNDYLIEQEDYIEELNELDLQYDELYRTLMLKKNEISRLNANDSQKIRTLAEEINGRVQAVDDIEQRIKRQADVYFANRKAEFHTTRRTVNLLRNRYGSNSGMASGDGSILDITN